MIVLSMKQAIALLSICFFVLGVVVDRTGIWFYNNYMTARGEDDTEESDCAAE